MNKSPAVTGVSRPYSGHTLAPCVHNCPIMMFRTFCCCGPKWKRSYLVIYITSDITETSVTSRNTCVANCDQTAADSDIVTIVSL